MPTYEYIGVCGHAFERVLPVAEFKSPQYCEKCGALGNRILSLPALAYAKPDCRYTSPIDGRPITSYAQRRDDLARNNCREYDPEMKTDAARFRQQQDAALDRSVDEHVEREFEHMDNRKRERLANELAAGATATVERLSPGE